jgi:hypothetical protein
MKKCQKITISCQNVLRLPYATTKKKPALPPAKHENKAAGRYSNGSARNSVGVFPKCRLQKVEKYCIDEKP